MLIKSYKLIHPIVLTQIALSTKILASQWQWQLMISACILSKRKATSCITRREPHWTYLKLELEQDNRNQINIRTTSHCSPHRIEDAPANKTTGGLALFPALQPHHARSPCVPRASRLTSHQSCFVPAATPAAPWAIPLRELSTAANSTAPSIPSETSFR